MTQKVVIVGRPNVGKSSLLNMLAGRRISIVDAMPGVTRDRISVEVELPAATPDGEPGRGLTRGTTREANRGTTRGADRGATRGADRGSRTIELIDTGGHGIQDTQDLTAEVERQIAVGVTEADLILFVVDSQTGLMPLDQQVAQLLRQQSGQAPVLVVANKVDDSTHEALAYEALQLGCGDPVMVSAANGYNKRALIDAIDRQLPTQAAPADDSSATATSPSADDERDMLVAIVGKRNAGKSTLVNALAGAQRVIVSEIPGTTRDAVDVRFELDGRSFIAIDTAGVRKRKSIKQDVEFYSHHRAMLSIRRADVVLMLIDASVPVSQVDSKLANEIVRHYKPCIVVVNKWDLAESDYTQDQYLTYMDKEVKGLSFAPIAFVSAVNSEGLRELMAMAHNLYEQAGHRVTTGELNRVIARILAERTPVSKVGKRPKVYYVTQLATHPPTIGLFVNNPDLFDPGYQRFLINRLRDELPYSEVPIKLLIRGRTQMPKGESGNCDL